MNVLNIVFLSVQDVRPGLVFKKSTKRQYELEEKHKSANEKMRKLQKPARELEVEKRQEGLEKAIGSSNKGDCLTSNTCLIGCNFILLVS